MVILKVNDKKYRIPVCWEDCTTDIFQRLYTLDLLKVNRLEVFAVMCDMKTVDIENSTDELVNEAVFKFTDFIYYQEQNFRDIAVNSEIQLLGKTIKVPGKLESLTVGQNMQVRSLMTNTKCLEANVSLAAAIYLQPLVDNMPFDMERVRIINNELRTKNIYEVFPIGFFFLKKQNLYGLSGLNYLRGKIHLSLWNVKRSRSLQRLKNLRRLLISQCLTRMAKLMDSRHVWFT